MRPARRTSRWPRSTADPSRTTRWSAGRVGSPPGLRDLGVGAGDVVGLLSYNSIEFLATIFAANHLGAIAMPINWRLAAAELRYLLEHSEARGAGVRRGVDRPRQRGDRGPRRRSSRGSACRRPTIEGWTRFVDLEREPVPERAQVRRRRHPPADVHLGNDRTAEGRDDHPRQPGLEELRPHHRVRVHGERRRAGVRAALPRRCARPRHDDDDRRRGDHDHPPHLRRRQGGRRDRALEGDHRLDGAGDDPGGARRARASTSATCRRCG